MREGLALLISFLFGALFSWAVTSHYYQDQRCAELNGVLINRVCVAKEFVK